MRPAFRGRRDRDTALTRDHHEGAVKSALSPAAWTAGDRMPQGKGELVLTVDDDAAVRFLIGLA